MKRLIAFALAAAMLLCLCSCGSKELKKGRYNLTDDIISGYIQVNGVNDGKTSKMYLSIDGQADQSLEGTIRSIRGEGDHIIYRFDISFSMGELLDQSMGSYITLYYYPETKTITAGAKDYASLWFVKE